MTAIDNVASALPYGVSIEACEQSREQALAALSTRREWEQRNAENPAHLASMLKTLDKLNTIYGNVDRATLAYAVANGIDWHARFNDMRHSGAFTNVYSMPKCPIIMRVCNGGAFRSDNTRGETRGDNNTVAATVLALASKAYGKDMANAVNDVCSAWGMGGGNYTAGNTQGGSSLRALHALGIVNEKGDNVLRDDDWKRLVSAAKKHDRAMRK